MEDGNKWGVAYLILNLVISFLGRLKKTLVNTLPVVHSSGPQLKGVNNRYTLVSKALVEHFSDRILVCHKTLLLNVLKYPVYSWHKTI